VKAIITGVVAATLLAAAAAFVLDTKLQQESTDRFQTSGVRL